MQSQDSSEPSGSGEPADFRNVFRKLSLPTLVKIILPADKILPKEHPAFGKTLIGGKTTAFVCFGRQCLAPALTPAELELLLRQERDKRHRPVANDG